MAQQAVQLDRETFSCSICLDPQTDQVTIPCGHNYCMSCIKTHWDGEDETETYSCPQCRKTFTPRPVLGENPMSLEERERTRENEQRIQNREKDVKLLQQEVDAINGSADKAVEHSEKTFTELIHLIQKRRSDLKQKLRSKQQTEVSRVRDLQKKQEQEIAELKRRDAELKTLSETDDHNQFLHKYTPPFSPLRYFEDIIAPVSEVRNKLQDVLRETWTNISLAETQVDVLLSQPEPKTRADFLKYSREITLDPNTAHKDLALSEGNRKATQLNEDESHPSHIDRFTDCPQVLSKKSLTGRSYWEVEWRAGVRIAVAYENISRAGEGSAFGENDKSWALDCYTDSYTFWYNNDYTEVSGDPESTRVGVYLDHSAGVLSFYSVIKTWTMTMTLLHRVQTKFTQPPYVPLHAGLGFTVGFTGSGDTAEFIKLK